MLANIMPTRINASRPPWNGTPGAGKEALPQPPPVQQPEVQMPGSGRHPARPEAAQVDGRGETPQGQVAAVVRPVAEVVWMVGKDQLAQGSEGRGLAAQLLVAGL